MLDSVWDHRVGLVIGPAGSGKTTLLAQFAANAGVPTAWYRAEACDVEAPTLLATLVQALSAVVPDLPEHPVSVEDLVASLDTRTERVLLIIDDLHTIAGSPGESVLERLVEYSPPNLRLLLASRRAPSFNLSRLRVSGELVEIDGHALRFRSWEVERLFRDLYHEPLRPEDLAALARRTEGWAAGLQLFHLATRGKPAPERHRILVELGPRTRMVREYLARNVLFDLPDEMRRFLVRTSVLGTLTGPLCDELLGGTGGAAMLRDLEDQQIFTNAIDEMGTYRYHEAMRSHLEAALVEEVGEDETRSLCRRAACLLETAGLLPDALRAHYRAEDWDAAARLLGRDGEQLAADQGSWLDAVPPNLLEHDPWVQLARARRTLAVGRLDAALTAYARAEQTFGGATAGETCRRERFELSAWLSPAPAIPSSWLGLARAATQHDPQGVAAVARGIPGASFRCVEGIALLLAGRLHDAGRIFHSVLELPDASAVVSLVARLGTHLVAAVDGELRSDRMTASADDAESLDLPWLARACRGAAMLLDGADDGTLAALRESSLRDGDGWLVAGLAFVEGLTALGSDRSSLEALQGAASGFHRLGAAVAEAWARAALAIAMAAQGHPDGRDVGLAAVALARSAAVPGAEAIAFAALASIDDHRRDEYTTVARDLAGSLGMPWPLAPASRPVGPATVTVTGATTEPRPAPSAVLRCFGGFTLELSGRAIDVRSLKPRQRAALHVLALHAGKSVHRETLVELLWPDQDTEPGTRNLHVAISSLRQLVEPGVGRGEASLIVREGDTYRLALNDDADVDLWTFADGVATGRSARLAGDVTAAIAAYEHALAAYVGDLLPEAGPADWVSQERERYRAVATECAIALAELHLQQGAPVLAASTCERALEIDRYRDGTWRLFAEALDRAGDYLAAARARQGYARILDELGVLSAP